jgi:gliding motility-associated-like protein
MCTGVTSYTVIDNTAAPTATSVANVNLPCGGPTSTITLNGGSPDPNVTYEWTGPGIVSGSNTTSPVVNMAGTYTLTVTNPATGCTSTSTVAVSNGMPVASFTTDITSGFAPQPVNFTDGSISSYSLSYSWNFGDGNTSTLQNPVNTYSVAGTYTAMLIVSTGLCSDSASVVIVIQDGFSLEIPNVFTPNGDNVNDVFTITSKGVKEITLQIFNRWGQLMYEFIGAKAAWDGITNNGQEASAGTYFYFVKAIGLDNKEVSKNGPVTLFR